MSPRSDWILIALAVLLVGCAGRSSRQVSAPVAVVPERGSYIDLQAGWRLSVITPLLKSGKFLAEAQPEKGQVKAAGNALSVEMAAGSDFLGYETSYYAVEKGDGGGVRVRFRSAETVRDGHPLPQKHSVVELFRLPRSARHVRLIYLVRVSRADHNMAVVAAAEAGDLNALTAQVQKDPSSGCQSRRGRVCQWIPAGIAVRPELKSAESADWTPAR